MAGGGTQQAQMRRKKQGEKRRPSTNDEGEDADGGGSEDNASISSGGTPDLETSRNVSQTHLAAMALIELPMAGGGGGGRGSGRSTKPKKRARSAVVTTEPSSVGDPGGWAKKVVRYAHENGQDLLSQVCGRYKLAYAGTLASIPETMQEQIAHCLLFNPSLLKNSEGLPVGIRECKGVKNFHMQFIQDADEIVRHIRISCELSGEPFAVQLRACSNCGSCFSGRFMDVGAHQRAGGWKEITERISAGKHSWSDLKGWRLCVPCFVNWGVKGSTENSKRASIDQVMALGLSSVSIAHIEGTTPETSSGGSLSSGSTGCGSSSGAKKRKSPLSTPPVASSRPKLKPQGMQPTRTDAKSVSPDNVPSTTTSGESPSVKMVRQVMKPKGPGGQACFPRKTMSSSSSSSSPAEAAQKVGVEKVEETVDGESMGAGSGVVGVIRMSDSTERAGQTRLHVAASKGDLPAVREIMMGPEKLLLMVKDKAGHTCLDCAAENGHLDVCFELCKTGGEGLILSQGKIGQTCLHLAASSGHLGVAKLLMDIGGRELILKCEERGATCLHWAVDAENIEMTRLLAKEGGPELIHVQDVVGKTCLHRAVDEGSMEMAELLADLGRKEVLLIKDGDNQTSVNRAVELGQCDIAQMLVEKGLEWFRESVASEDSRPPDERRRLEDLQRREEEITRREQVMDRLEAEQRRLGPGTGCRECMIRYMQVCTCGRGTQPIVLPPLHNLAQARS